jgi:hypothetical protein
MSPRNSWINLITRYGRPRYKDNLDEDTLKLAIAERRAFRLVRQPTSVRSLGYLHLELAKVSDAIKGGAMNHGPDSLSCPYLSIVFSRPCEITDEEVNILEKVRVECWKACEFTNSTCSCYQVFFCQLATKYSFC